MKKIQTSFQLPLKFTKEGKRRRRKAGMGRKEKSSLRSADPIFVLEMEFSISGAGH